MKIILEKLHISFTDNGVTDSLVIDISDAPQTLTRFAPKEDSTQTVVATIDGLILKDISRTAPLAALTELNDCEICVTVVSVFTISLNSGVITSESLMALTSARTIDTDLVAYYDTYTSVVDKINRCVVGVDAMVIVEVNTKETV